MKAKLMIGRIIIFLGIILVGIASVLFVQNYLAEKNAKEVSSEVVAQILEQIEDSDEQTDDTIDSSAQGDDTISIDGSLYIGVLEITSLNLVLPIQDEWSYTKLRDTPCVYKSEPFIIAAHNYDAHFGRINQLELGAQVKFIDVSGTTFYYEVMEVEMLKGTDVLEMVSTEYDLTLFTCNYNNNTQRVVVRLNLI